MSGGGGRVRGGRMRRGNEWRGEGKEVRGGRMRRGNEWRGVRGERMRGRGGGGRMREVGSE